MGGDPRMTPHSMQVHHLAAATALALLLPACKSSDGASAATSATGSAAAAAPAGKPTRVEKVTMNGVSWEVTLPADMKAPEYKVTSPEYSGDQDVELKLDTSFPKFSSIDGYITRNVATKVLEKKQIGDAHFVVVEPQKAGTFSMTALVLDDTIGWRCSGAKERAAEIQAMCESVKFKRQ